MTKEDFEKLKSTVKQWLFHTGSLDPTNYANELKLKFIEPKEKRIEELMEENRQLRNEVEDLRAYCNQIGKVKTEVLKAFEHIVAR